MSPAHNGLRNAMTGLLQKLKRFMDENRREQQNLPDWHERLRGIYVAHQRWREKNTEHNHQSRRTHDGEK